MCIAPLKDQISYIYILAQIYQITFGYEFLGRSFLDTKMHYYTVYE